MLRLSVEIGGLETTFGGMGGSGFLNFLSRILVIVLGVTGARNWCELPIMLFKMNEALQDIRRK